MKRIDTIIFDWAGTTVDFGCFAPLGAFVDAFKKREIDITIAEAREHMGMKKIDHVRDILNMPRVISEWKNRHGAPPEQADVQALYSEFEKKIFKNLAQYCVPLPGVCGTVQQLKEAGIKIGSTTGYTGEMMEILAPEAKKQGYSPDSLVTSTDVPQGMMSDN
jgi:phosphonoacetaldehyde hydrolase